MQDYYNVQEATIENRTDQDGNPTGGFYKSCGVYIQWQDGPRKLPSGKLADPNGAFVEDAINAALTRLQFFNEGKFRCRENSLAITHLEEALHWLKHRQVDRSNRGVEGAHEV